MAGVGGFVEAGERAFAAGHDNGGGGIEGLDAAEVEVVGIGRGGAALPAGTVVGGAEDGAFGAGGPGNSVAEGVDAAEVGGGGGGLDLPLGGCRSGEEESGEEEGRAHLVEVYAGAEAEQGPIRRFWLRQNDDPERSEGFGVCWSR